MSFVLPDSFKEVLKQLINLCSHTYIYQLEYLKNAGTIIIHLLLNVISKLAAFCSTVSGHWKSKSACGSSPSLCRVILLRICGHLGTVLLAPEYIMSTEEWSVYTFKVIINRSFVIEFSLGLCSLPISDMIDINSTKRTSRSTRCLKVIHCDRV